MDPKVKPGILESVRLKPTPEQRRGRFYRVTQELLEDFLADPDKYGRKMFLKLVKDENGVEHAYTIDGEYVKRIDKPLYSPTEEELQKLGV